MKISALSFITRPDPEVSTKGMVKDLGLIVSADLNWHPHYQLITSKAYKMLGLLHRVFSGSIFESAKFSLYTLIHSQLLYCSPIWHPYLLRDIHCLELVQQKATKFITNYSDLDYRNRLIKLKLLPLMMEYEIIDVKLLVKLIKFPSDHFNICDLNFAVIQLEGTLTSNLNTHYVGLILIGTFISIAFLDSGNYT